MHADEFGRMNHLFKRYFYIPQGDIIQDRSGKKKYVLQYHSDGPAERAQFISFDGPVVNQYPSFLNGV